MVVSKLIALNLLAGGPDMGDDELTDKQRAILETNKENPGMSREEIAVETDSSASYVGQVLNDYDESDLDDGGNGLLILILIIIGGGFLLANGDGNSSSILLAAISTRSIKNRIW